MGIPIILTAFIAGFIITLACRFPPKFFKGVDIVLNISLLTLISAMGTTIAIDEGLLANLLPMGLQALSLALGSIFGSLLFIQLLSPTLKTKGKVAEKTYDVGNIHGSGIFTLVLFGVLLLGFAVGRCFNSWSLLKYIPLVVAISESLLLFSIGLSLGRNLSLLKEGISYGWRLAVYPILIGVGSIAGAMTVGFFWNIGYNEAAAIGAGFGWYSLAGIITTNMHSVELGTLAFLANLIRELFTFLALPLIARWLGKIAAIAPGGATAMDTTLPLIKKVAGDEMILPAFVSGLVLSILVPLLVPLLLQL